MTANNLSRRTVAKGAAWSTPVLVAAAAARPAAASIDDTSVTSTRGCKLPGLGQNTKDYRLTACLTNSSGATVIVTAPSTLTVGSKSYPATSTPTRAVLGAGETACFEVLAKGLKSSENTSLSAAFTVSQAGQESVVKFASATAKPC